MSEQSGLMKHALSELEIAGYGKDAKGQSLITRNNVLKLLKVYCSNGNPTPCSLLELEIFRRLARWDVISPLTLTDDNEFMEVGTGVFQSKRKYNIFKENDRFYDISCFLIKLQWSKRKESDKLELMKFPNIIQGRVYEREENIATGRYFLRCLLPANCETWMPKEPIVITTVGIETEKDNWTAFFEKGCNEVKTLESMYEIKWEMSEEWKGKEIIPNK